MNGRPFYALTLILLVACGNGGSDSSSAALSDSTALVREASPEGEDAVAPEALIREYYDAITAHDYRRAYLHWGDSGRLSNQTFEQFRVGFDHTASVKVQIGEPGRIEGAAGSRYVEIPVEIEAETDSGALQRFTGSYTLRRSVVDGATEAQRRWHIYAAEIAPGHDAP